jgi:uncharacterized membrane protein YqjE
MSEEKQIQCGCQKSANRYNPHILKALLLKGLLEACLLLLVGEGGLKVFIVILFNPTYLQTKLNHTKNFTVFYLIPLL